VRTIRRVSVRSGQPHPSQFSVFWPGQGVSIVGSEISAFAVPMVGLLALHISTAEVGFLTTAAMAPNVLAPFLAGTVVDRQAKRSLMAACDLLRAIAMGSIPALFAAGLLTFWLLLFITFFVGLCGVLFDTAFFVLVPMIVPDAVLPRANGRIESTRSVARVLGPAIGGALVQALGPTWPMLLDAGSFVASVATLRAIRVPDDVPARTGVRTRYWPEVAAGFRALWGLPAIRLLNLIVGSFNFFSGAAAAIMTLFIIRVLEVSPAAYGACVAFGFTGGVVAGALAGRISAHVSARTAFIIGIGLSGVSEPAIAACRAHAWWLVIVLVVAFFLTSFGLTVYTVTNTTVRQALIAPAERSKVYAAMRVFSRVTIPMGSAAGGIGATATSPRLALLLAGLGEVAVAGALIACRRTLPREWTSDDKLAIEAADRPAVIDETT
jgi:MFS family permease